MKVLSFLLKSIIFLAASAAVFARLMKHADRTVFQPLLEQLRMTDRFSVTERAVLVEKITESVSRSDGGQRTEYCLLFHTDGGPLECRVSESVYAQAFEGMEGLLTRRGHSFESFEVSGIRIV